MAEYAPIGILFLVVAGLALVIMLAAHLLPKRHRSGPVKDSAYESGVEAIGDARRRFNIRFYLVAMLFLLFDVELIFMYPWAQLFHQSTMGQPSSVAAPPGLTPTFLLGEMAVFMLVLLVGYIYAWRRKVFAVS